MQEPELEGIDEEQGPKPADGAGPTTAENGQGSKAADDEPETAWYKDPLVRHVNPLAYIFKSLIFNMRFPEGLERL